MKVVHNNLYYTQPAKQAVLIKWFDYYAAGAV